MSFVQKLLCKHKRFLHLENFLSEVMHAAADGGVSFRGGADLGRVDGAEIEFAENERVQGPVLLPVPQTLQVRASHQRRLSERALQLQENSVFGPIQHNRKTVKFIAQNSLEHLTQFSGGQGSLRIQESHSRIQDAPLLLMLHFVRKGASYTRNCTISFDLARTVHHHLRGSAPEAVKTTAAFSSRVTHLSPERESRQVVVRLAEVKVVEVNVSPATQRVQSELDVAALGVDEIVHSLPVLATRSQCLPGVPAGKVQGFC